MIYTEVNVNEFIRYFLNSSYKNNFCIKGLRTLYNYLNDFEENIGLDIVGICCDYTEYEDFKEFKKEYNIKEIKTEKDIINYTTYLKIDGTNKFIILNF